MMRERVPLPRVQLGEFEGFHGPAGEAVGSPGGNDLGRTQAHRPSVFFAKGRHPGQFGRHFLDIEWDRIGCRSSLRGSGTSVAAQPARDDTRSGKPLAAASLTTRPQGSERLGSTNAAAWA